VTDGFPFVLVDSLDEITPTRLDAWWRELSPALPYARWGVTVRGVRELLTRQCEPQPRLGSADEYSDTSVNELSANRTGGYRPRLLASTAPEGAS